MGFFRNLFVGGAERPAEKPTEMPKAEGLSEDKEREWFKQGGNPVEKKEEQGDPEAVYRKPGEMTETQEEDWYIKGEQK